MGTLTTTRNKKELMKENTENKGENRIHQSLLLLLLLLLVVALQTDLNSDSRITLHALMKMERFCGVFRGHGRWRLSKDDNGWLFSCSPVYLRPKGRLGEESSEFGKN